MSLTLLTQKLLNVSGQIVTVRGFNNKTSEPLGLKVKNTAFYTHSITVCRITLVCLSRTHRFSFVTLTHGVPCEVRPEYVSLI